MLPVILEYEKGVKIISCKNLQGKIYDLLIVEMTGEIVKATKPLNTPVETTEQE